MKPWDKNKSLYPKLALLLAKKVKPWDKNKSLYPKVSLSS